MATDIDEAAERHPGGVTPRTSRRSGARPTMRDVAARAGVSQMTVSFVVNDSKPVSDATREAVNAAVTALGYVPNRAAQRLASATELRIGLLHSSVPNAFLSALLVGVLNAASRCGAQLHVEKFDQTRPELLDAAIAHLVAGGATGLLFHSPISEIAAAGDGWRAHNVPAVAIAPGAALRGLPSVRNDEAAAARAMTRLLLDHGHRRIGFIAGPTTHSASAARLSGFRAAHRECYVTVSEELIEPGEFDFESGAAAAERLLDRADRPTAIFASNDAMASGVLAQAIRRGLSIPADLSVTGFDDTPIATQIWPTLTTIRRDVTVMAERAVAMLASSKPERPGGATVAIHDQLTGHELIERLSVTTPPRRG